MKTALGIRAEPTAVHWAFVTGSSDHLVLHAHGSEVAPNSYGEGEVLAWIRQRLLHILDTYKPAQAGIRYAERKAKGANTDSAKSRCRVEGVALEVASTSNIAITTGALGTFGKFAQSKTPAEDLESEHLRGLDWSKFKDKKLREAIYVAASLLAKG
jgi:hypothetical protein